ncbi:D-lyxose/D-mannose family sugar isomerase [Aquimarina sp. U1-2]|uniref:D-lyxose/D-mannose family sugar isomerase n=1 Tax=Aquimarina sp. U1-2 TaxID=2823141 RepID=UPI001AECF1E9|nr:D-lyxose/D-mannose family sugar isomerase [Aquimarina sp. U1-2]MBP2832901.1 D-lyxose/D-mannose family sugar isomerase [Aquimarina sp. U1-2]
MKRSQINHAIREAEKFFKKHLWALPPHPRWDVTDFGLGDFDSKGLVLINLAEEPEYCEKLMFAKNGQRTPAHCHAKKKEDIIVRTGKLAVQLWHERPFEVKNTFQIKVSGNLQTITSGEIITLQAGERVTLVPGVYHEFYPISNACIIGEVSTANDDLNDNFFVDPEIGRFSDIEEDEPAIVKLISDKYT